MKMLLKFMIGVFLGLTSYQVFAFPLQTVTGYGSARGTNTLGAQKDADLNALQQCGALLAQRVTIYTCYGFLGQIACNADFRCVNDLHQPLGFDPEKTVEAAGYSKTRNFEDARTDLLRHTKQQCGYRPVVQITDLKCRTIGVIDKYSECRFYYFCK